MKINSRNLSNESAPEARDKFQGNCLTKVLLPGRADRGELSNEYHQGGQGGKRDILELSNDLSIPTALVYKDRQAGLSTLQDRQTKLTRQDDWGGRLISQPDGQAEWGIIQPP